MTANVKYSRLRLLLRRAVVIIIIFFLVLVIVQVSRNLLKKERAVSNISRPETQALTLQQQFQALEFSGEKRRISLKAEKFYLDADQKQRLEGGVEIVDEELAEKLVLRAQKVLIDPEKKVVKAEGEVELNAGSVQVAAAALEYHFQDKGINSAGVRININHLSLNAEKMYYGASQERGIFEGVEGKSLKAETKFSFLASRARWEKDQNRIQAEDLTLKSRGVTVTAKSGLIVLQEDGSDFDSFQLEGKVELHWRSLRKAGGLEEIEIRSEKLGLCSEGNTIVLSSPEGFEFRGKDKTCMVKAQGENLKVIFSTEREAQKLLATNSNWNLQKNEAGPTILSGKQVDYDLISGCLDLRGQSTLQSEHYWIELKHLLFNLADGSFTAQEFQSEIKPGFFTRKAILFNPENSLFISGENLAVASEVFDMQGKVRIWQASDFCLVEKARLERTSGNISLEGLERAVWHYLDAKEQRKELNLSGEKALLLPGEKKILVTGKVRLGLEELEMKTGEITIFTEEATSEKFSYLEASGQVRLVWKDYQAASERASLNFKENTVILTGQPELRSQSGDRLEADKLTLFLADDRIRVENQKRERSLTILVRGK